MTGFFEIAQILALAAVLGMAGLRLKQPLVIAFLAAGILAGPSFLGIIHSYEQVELFAHIGIAVLLFIVGLKLDLHLIRTTGPVALATGLGQVVFTSIIGFGIAVAMGMDTVSAAYVSVALTFSSTIIIVKLLSDKKEIDSLHGRIALGFLIVQDIVAILALIGLSSLGTSAHGGESRLAASLLVLAKGAGLVAGVWVVMRTVLPPLTRKIASSQEMLLLFADTWAMLVGAASDLLGLTKEVGAFLAGVALASTEYRDALSARLVTLRDFLLVFFFVDLGARMEWSHFGPRVFEASVFSAFVLVGNPLIVLAIMGAMGYRRRTGFLAGLTVAQISEFSLIVVASGLALGHIGQEIVGLVTVVGVVTILASTYMILYSDRLYQALSRWLRAFERANPYREAQCNDCFIMPRVDVVLVGLGGYGRELAEHLLERGRHVIGVDFDPEALEYCAKRGIPVLYGDMADPETIDGLPFLQARWVVSTTRNPAVDVQIVRHLRAKGFGGRIALTARTKEDAEAYLHFKPDVVLRPFFDAAEQGADALTGAWHALSDKTGWPVSFVEIRVKAGSTFAGHAIRDIPLRSELGVAIAAVSRAGRVFFNPEPDLRIFPSDRVVLMGPPEAVKRAETMIHRLADAPGEDDGSAVSLVEVQVGPGSPQAGKTLGETGFRRVTGPSSWGSGGATSTSSPPGPTNACSQETRCSCSEPRMHSSASASASSARPETRPGHESLRVPSDTTRRGCLSRCQEGRRRAVMPPRPSVGWRPGFGGDEGRPLSCVAGVFRAGGPMPLVAVSATRGLSCACSAGVRQGSSIPPTGPRLRPWWGRHVNERITSMSSVPRSSPRLRPSRWWRHSAGRAGAAPGADRCVPVDEVFQFLPRLHGDEPVAGAVPRLREHDGRDPGIMELAAGVEPVVDEMGDAEPREHLELGRVDAGGLHLEATTVYLRQVAPEPELDRFRKGPRRHHEHARDRAHPSEHLPRALVREQVQLVRLVGQHLDDLEGVRPVHVDALEELVVGYVLVLEGVVVSLAGHADEEPEGVGDDPVEVEGE